VGGYIYVCVCECKCVWWEVCVVGGVCVCVCVCACVWWEVCGVWYGVQGNKVQGYVCYSVQGGCGVSVQERG
jgi:hypothetical protein